jgi:hypothetical protein
MSYLARTILCLASCTASGILSAPLRAAEPVEEFLAALRRRGYHDMAVEYLQQVAAGPHADAEFKRRYSYELGSVLLDAARAAGEPLERDRLAEQAITRLKEFVASGAEDNLVAEAQSKLADTMLERGRAMAARASRSRDREALLQTARSMLVEAGKTYQTVEKYHLAEFNREAPQADRERKNALGGPILEARLRAAQAVSDLAKTYEPGSAEAIKALKQGIDRYATLYEKYAGDGFLAAYAARVHEASNYLDLGQPDEAISRLADVLSLPVKEEALRDLVLTPAHLVALKAWLKKGEFKNAIEKAASYAGDPSSAESLRPDWLEMQYLLASAYHQQAQALRGGDPQRTKYETEARKLAGQVVKVRSEVQDDARLLLGKLGRPADEAAADFKTFDEGFDKATTAVQQYTGAKLAFDNARQSAEADHAELTRLNQAITNARDAAFRTVEQTLALSNDKSDLAKVNTARFYLCFLHWELAQAQSADKQSSSHYYDAAVLGDFLARQFPEHANARQAMAIAMAAYQRIRQDAAAEAQQAAEKAGASPAESAAAVDAAVASWSGKLAQLAEHAIARWPDAEEAANAVAVLASVAIERQDFAAARALAEKLKPGSAGRAELELRLGRAIWGHYVRTKKARDEARSQAEPNADAQIGSVAGDRAADKALAQSANEAQALLESGLKAALAGEQINRTAVLGQWALIQSYVTTSHPEKAIPWLEAPKHGLLALVNDKHEAAEIEGLLFDAYRLALRSYIAVKPQQLDKALATMDALEKITGNDPKGREKLTSVYIAMGRDLQEEIERLLALGDVAEVEALSTAFEAFLKRLAERESGNTFNSLFWVADTYAELGDGVGQAGSAANEKRSREHFQQAVTAFEKIIERDQADAEFMPDKYLPLVQLRLAKAYRGAGEFDKALALLSTILKDKPNILDLQFDAAYTYQEQAESDPAKHSALFRRAILGGDPANAEHIWGWNALAQRIRAQKERLARDTSDPANAARAEQYRQRYHEARYNSVYCTFELARLATSPSEKSRLLKIAKQGIWSVFSIVDPQLGGGQWRVKNDRLLKDIQTALGEPAVGLQEFEKRRRDQSATNNGK